MEKVFPTLIALAEKGIVDYCKDLKNMGFKIFTGSLELDLVWSWLHKIETISITLQIFEHMRLPCAVQFLEDHTHIWWKTTV